MNFFLKFFFYGLIFFTFNNLGFTAEAKQATEHNNKLKLNAEKISYKEDLRQLVASTNVSLKFNDVEVKAPKLTLDVDKHTLWGTGNIKVWRGKDNFIANSLFFNLDKNNITVESLDIAVRPADLTTGNLYIKVAKLEDTPEVKKGQKGFLTTCDYPEPHYFMQADSFEYYPDEGITGHNVLAYAPIGAVPFGLWSPLYYYDLGKRNPILLFPLIGQNDVEGWFVRTTWDYFYKKNQTGQFYIDWLEKKGIGLGIKHDYKMPKSFQGSVYYYKLDENDTGINDYKIVVDHTGYLSDTLSFNIGYEDINGYTLGGGRKRIENKDLSFISKDLGDVFNFSLNEGQNFLQKNKNQSMQFSKSFNNNQDLVINANSNEYFQSNRKNDELALKQNLKFANKIAFQDNIRYTAASESTKNQNQDLYINAWLTQTYEATDIIKNFKLDLSYFYDVDGDLVTTDANQVYLQKMPEITLDFGKQQLFPSTADIQLDFTEKVLLGKYNEARYISTASQVRNFTASRYRLEQTGFSKFKKLWFNFVLDLKITYYQNIYDTNDELYSLAHNHVLSADWFSFMKPKLIYDKSDAVGNTPFFFDDNSRKQEQIKEVLTLYYLEENKYKWDHSMGWDWIKQKRIDYQTELNIKPDNAWQLNLKTGFHFDENRYYPTDAWDDLVGSLVITPSGNSYLNFKNIRNEVSYDLDKGELKRFRQNLDFVIGDTWESMWVIVLGFEYFYSPKEYKLQEVSLVKDLHCREITLKYNEAIKEIRFTYTIKSFPNDSVGFSTSEKEPFKFQGILDDEANERF